MREGGREGGREGVKGGREGDGGWMGEGEREGWWGREGRSEGREGGNQVGRDRWVEGDIAAGPKSSRVSMLASLRTCELAKGRSHPE